MLRVLAILSLLAAVVFVVMAVVTQSYLASLPDILNGLIGFVVLMALADIKDHSIATWNKLEEISSNLWQWQRDERKKLSD